MNKSENFNIGSPKPEKESRPSQPELMENKENTQEQLSDREAFKKTSDELKIIEGIRHQIQEKASPPLQQEKSIHQNPTEIEVINGRQYIVEYVPKEDIYPAYGYSRGNSVVVRQDLPPRVKNFVKAHELYHCQDKTNFGGWLGREIRANVIPGLKDPIGLAATVWKTITDMDRIKFYLKRMKEGH